jgi:hypothetical protein
LATLATKKEMFQFLLQVDEAVDKVFWVSGDGGGDGGDGVGEDDLDYGLDFLTVLGSEFILFLATILLSPRLLLH